MVRWTFSAATASVVTLLASGAYAQTFPPDADWVPLERGGIVLGDPVDDAQDSRDIVGDETHAGAFTFRDDTYLYFRLRVDDDPMQNPNNFGPFAWGVEFDVDGNSSNYEYLAMVNGIENPDVVSLEQNTVQSAPGDPKDPAEVVLATYPTDTHARSLTADTTFSDDPDYFVDWAVDLQDLVDAGFDPEGAVRFIFGTSNSAHTLDADLLAPVGETTIDGAGTDPVQCVGGNCVVCNTDAACGPDCAPCPSATPHCTGARCVQCLSSSHCSGSTPICDPNTGTCVGGCSSDADCTESGFPACLPSGECAECSATNDTLCVGAEPVCNVAAGVCTSECTTDADCTSASTPACLPGGVCAECSSTNDSACGGATPQCDAARGLCISAGSGGSGGGGGSGGAAAGEDVPTIEGSGCSLGAKRTGAGFLLLGALFAFAVALVRRKK